GLLAGAHQVHGEQPLVQRDLAALKHGADRDGKLLAAGFALQQAGTVGRALKGIRLAFYAAMRADRTVRPTQRLKVSASLVSVLEVRGEQISGHGARSVMTLEDYGMSDALNATAASAV